MIGRLQHVLAEKQIGSFSKYFDYVTSDNTGNAVATLVNRLTTNHTFFLREAEHFDYFKNHVLPILSTCQAPSKDLRIWSAGCSTGEEPYTLAMIVSDYFGIEKGGWDAQILATDISSGVLEKAIAGVYHVDQIANVPVNWKNKYFKPVDRERMAVVERIKSEVIFRRFNLMNAHFPFKKKFHVIFCRNVMIYFDVETRQRLVEKFYEHTEPGGYLFIGHSESLNRKQTKYDYIMPAVYRKG